MKANRLVFTLLLLLSAAVSQLPAQQSEADRKLLADIRAKAEKGDAQSQFELAKTFDFGNLGVAKDAVEAAKWYREAAEQNIAGAQLNLGVCYHDGQGVTKDEAEAVKWFRKAAEQNLPEAQSNLGKCYADGEGVAKDAVEAVKWYRKAANAGNANSQASLAGCYLTGRGVSRDLKSAFEFARQAADQGNVLGRRILATCFSDGIGTPADLAAAAKIYRDLANQGDVSSQHNLAIMYENGDGVPQDFVEAYKWYNIAASAEDVLRDFSVRRRGEISRRMTPAQIAEAQRLSREFKPRSVPDSGPSKSGKEIAESNPSASATGFFISADGFLVTNEHVVRDTAQIRLVTSAGLISAKVVKVDAANDLALLKAEGRFAALPVAASRGVKLGGTVATVGFPNIGLQGFAPKLAKGEIASLSGAGDDARYFQISVPVQPGNSGGALVDERGNVVGVVSAKLSARAALASSGALPENVNYAVKSSFLLGFLESVPEVTAKLKEPETKERKFEEVVKSAEQAAVLVLVY